MGTELVKASENKPSLRSQVNTGHLVLANFGFTLAGAGMAYVFPPLAWVLLIMAIFALAMQPVMKSIENTTIPAHQLEERKLENFEKWLYETTPQTYSQFTSRLTQDEKTIWAGKPIGDVKHPKHARAARIDYLTADPSDDHIDRLERDLDLAFGLAEPKEGERIKDVSAVVSSAIRSQGRVPILEPGVTYNTYCNRCAAPMLYQTTTGDCDICNPEQRDLCRTCGAYLENGYRQGKYLCSMCTKENDYKDRERMLSAYRVPSGYLIDKYSGRLSASKYRTCVDSGLDCVYSDQHDSCIYCHSAYDPDPPRVSY